MSVCIVWNTTSVHITRGNDKQETGLTGVRFKGLFFTLWASSAAAGFVKRMYNGIHWDCTNNEQIGSNGGLSAGEGSIALSVT